MCQKTEMATMNQSNRNQTKTKQGGEQMDAKEIHPNRAGLGTFVM